MDAPLIRPATAKDAPALSACITAAYAKSRTILPDLPDVSGGLLEDIATHHVWVAVANGQTLGGLVLALHPDHGHLMNVAVHPDARGLGLGRRLLDTAVAVTRAAGLPSLDLATHKDLSDSIALYTHLGWIETGRDGTRVLFSRAL